jgi:hypothetical protein
MNFFSINLSFAILFFSLTVLVRGQDDACADETAAWTTCLEANPGGCDTCDEAFSDATDISAEGLDLSDATAIAELLCTTLKSIGCVMQTCGCDACIDSFDAYLKCYVESNGIDDCDSTCASDGSSAPGALSAKMMAPVLFGSLMLLA